MPYFSLIQHRLHRNRKNYQDDLVSPTILKYYRGYTDRSHKPLPPPSPGKECRLKMPITKEPLFKVCLESSIFLPYIEKILKTKLYEI
jgi:hypothetical protein